MPLALLLELYSLQCTSESTFSVLKFIQARCLAVSRMTKDFPEAEFGPNIPFREYSLPDNPKANISQADIVNVTVCQVCQFDCCLHFCITRKLNVPGSMLTGLSQMA